MNSRLDPIQAAVLAREAWTSLTTGPTVAVPCGRRLYPKGLAESGLMILPSCA